jgi:hypothetical protein
MSGTIFQFFHEFKKILMNEAHEAKQYATLSDKILNGETLNANQQRIFDRLQSLLGIIF